MNHQKIKDSHKVNPKVSVIIPAYNAGTWIERCITSVFHQGWRNIEVVAVNDGSVDDTLEKLTSLRNRDKRLVVIDKLNEGVVKARSVGVGKATGEYLLFLDADDYLPENAVALMAERTRECEADLCVGSYTLEWEGSGRKVLLNNRKRFVTPQGCFKYCLKHGEMFFAIKMFKTDLYRRAVNIPEDVIIQEDVIGLTQYLEVAEKVCWVEESVYYYVKRAESVTGRFTPRHISSLLKVADFLRENKFAMTMPGIVNRHCAGIAHKCVKSSLISEEDRIKAIRLWKNVPAATRINVRVKSMKSNLKAFIKRLVR